MMDWLKSYWWIILIGLTLGSLFDGLRREKRERAERLRRDKLSEEERAEEDRIKAQAYAEVLAESKQAKALWKQTRLEIYWTLEIAAINVKAPRF